MYKKNLESVIYLDLSILLIVFLNRAAISLLIFFFFLNLVLKEMNTHAILCHLVKSLNYVVYEHVLIKRVTEEIERMLIIVNINRVFTQSLTLILFHFIETTKTSFLNTLT